MFFGKLFIKLFISELFLLLLKFKIKKLKLTNNYIFRLDICKFFLSPQKFGIFFLIKKSKNPENPNVHLMRFQNVVSFMIYPIDSKWNKFLRISIQFDFEGTKITEHNLEIQRPDVSEVFKLFELIIQLIFHVFKTFVNEDFRVNFRYRI